MTTLTITLENKHRYIDEHGKLTVSSKVKKVDCSNNKLTCLKAPEGIQELNCSDNKLIYVNVPKSLEYLDIENNRDLVYPPKEICSKLTKEIVEWCKENEIPQRLLLPQRFKERWNVIRLMYIAHYTDNRDYLDSKPRKSKSSISPNFNFNMIPIEIITKIITRYVLT